MSLPTQTSNIRKHDETSTSTGQILTMREEPDNQDSVQFITKKNFFENEIQHNTHLKDPSRAVV